MDRLDDLVVEREGELDGVLGIGPEEAFDDQEVGERIAVHVPEIGCGEKCIDDALH